jgi:casein kinase II subunit beta
MFAYIEAISKGHIPHNQHSSVNQEGTTSSDWIRIFTSEHNWLCVLDDAYINDNFNHYGLSSVIEDYPTVLKVVRGQPPDGSLSRRLMKDAETLYGLMHARFLLTFPGIKLMQPKFESRLFGTCRRVGCNYQALLPIGLSPTPGEKSVKTFCPCCQDIYDTENELDGAYFGPYFPPLFVQMQRGLTSINPKILPRLSLFGLPIDPESPMNRCKYVR